ncbi:MAG: hypothetical protein JSS70_16370, partial [Bacteroidetes bacterium]|nr:hypothetical protein [Bacteroidota bacterium]
MRVITATLLFLLFSEISNAQSYDFTDAVIYTPELKNEDAGTPLQVLQQEVKKRTGAEWKQVKRLSHETRPVIILTTLNKINKL